MKTRNGQNDTRDQIIAVTVLGAVWIIGLCMYLYFTHYSVDVTKASDTAAPIVTTTQVVLPPSSIGFEEYDSVVLSSLHSSEMSDAIMSNEFEEYSESFDVNSDGSIIFDDDYSDE